MARKAQTPAAQLALLAAAAPEGDDWVHEIKYDGFRILIERSARGVRLWTRNGKDWTDRYPAVARSAAALAARDFVMDGEVVIVGPDGRTSFQALQNTDRSRGELVFYAFDLLSLDGSDLRRRPLLERKERLQALLASDGEPIRYSDHVRGGGPVFFEEACRLGLEGIISKRADAPYRPGRGNDWLKVKCVQVQEFVVGGFTDPGGSRTGFGALLVGTFEDGALHYRGKVGTGFNDATLRQLHRRLRSLETSQAPFVKPPRGADAKGAHWVQPELVAQIHFTDMTEDGKLRHPSFQGLREDKPAAAVTLEEPVSTARKTSPEEDAGGRPARRSRQAEAPSTASARRRTARPAEAKKPAAKSTRRGKEETAVAGVRLTSPDKVLYPEQGVTKLDLATYYETVADRMIPHIAGRPLTLVRCPAGHEKQCFFQKHIDYVPEGVRQVKVPEKDSVELYGVLDGVEGLIGLVQLGVLELHTWNSREDRLERPDRFVIDLDPDEGMDWSLIAEAAGHVREVLEELGLESFLKTTGGKGLHIVVPIARRTSWDDVKEFSRGIALLLARAAPDRYTIEVSKKKRRGRILIDYLRNARGSTAVEVYSTRARPGAPVSAPIAWSELGKVRGDSFTVENLPARLKKQRVDPWKDFGAVKQSLTAPMRRKLGL